MAKHLHHTCVTPTRRWLALLVLLLAGLAGVRGEQQVPASAPEAVAPTGTADLYIFNDSGRTLVPAKQKVTDNGRPLASLARQTYAHVVVPAGPHLLRPDPYLWKQEVRLTLEPGTRHYVVIAYKPERSWALPAAGAPLILREISEAEAEPLLREMTPQP